jgi:DNA-binding CsgD family transcriptional regulator
MSKLPKVNRGGLTAGVRQNYAIGKHPKRKEIEAHIISGQLSNSEIARRYGIHRESVARYRDNILLPEILSQQQIVAKERQNYVEEVQRKQITSAEQLFDMILIAVERMNKLSDACDEYLQDPDDPAKYFVGEREDEIQVIGQRVDEKGKVYNVKSTLSDIMAQLSDAGYRVSRMQSYKADPRVLLIKTAETLTKQMGTLIEAWARVEETQRAYASSPEWKKLTSMLQEIAGLDQSVRQKITQGLERLL